MCQRVEQEVKRADEMLVRDRVTAFSLDAQGRPARFLLEE